MPTTSSLNNATPYESVIAFVLFRLRARIRPSVEERIEEPAPPTPAADSPTA